MIRIDKHIRDLLQENECVIVPKMGGILNSPSLKGPNLYQLSSGPDSLRLSFNTFLNYNDGLLANHIVKQEKITYTEALTAIEKYVDEFHKELSSGNRFTIERVGVLYADTGNVIRFEPIGNPDNSKEKDNTAGADHKLEQEKEISQLMNKLESLISSESLIIDQPKSVVSSRKRFIRLFLLLTGSMLLLCLFIYFSGSRESNPAVPENAPSATPEIENGISTVYSVSSVPGVNTLPLKYYIVVGSFNSIENSIKKREEMRSKGFKSTQIISETGRPHLVSIRHFTSLEEAQQKLEQVRGQFKEAWIYSN